jgi:hypothetical protein
MCSVARIVIRGAFYETIFGAPARSVKHAPLVEVLQQGVLPTPFGQNARERKVIIEDLMILGARTTPSGPRMLDVSPVGVETIGHSYPDKTSWR